MQSIRFGAMLCVGVIVAAGTNQTVLARGDAKVQPRTTRVSIVTDAKTIGRYSPAAITVHVGARIVFRNASNAPHTVSADKGGFDSGTIFTGKLWTYTARKAGTFTYFCQFHPGMHGKIVIKRP